MCKYITLEPNSASSWGRICSLSCTDRCLLILSCEIVNTDALLYLQNREILLYLFKMHCNVTMCHHSVLISSTAYIHNEISNYFHQDFRNTYEKMNKNRHKIFLYIFALYPISIKYYLWKCTKNVYLANISPSKISKRCLVSLKN